MPKRPELYRYLSKQLAQSKQLSILELDDHKWDITLDVVGSPSSKNNTPGTTSKCPYFTQPFMLVYYDLECSNLASYQYITHQIHVNTYSGIINKHKHTHKHPSFRCCCQAHFSPKSAKKVQWNLRIKTIHPLNCSKLVLIVRWSIISDWNFSTLKIRFRVPLWS